MYSKNQFDFIIEQEMQFALWSDILPLFGDFIIIGVLVEYV